MQVVEQHLGCTSRGEAVRTWTLCNSDGVALTVCSLGATILGIDVPSHDGAAVSVAPCHQTVAALEAKDGSNPKMGTTCGRVANRTANARFTTSDGVEHALTPNDGLHSIHGGLRGWDACVWALAGLRVTGSAAGVKLQLVSPAGDEGFPGTVTATALISLTYDGTVGVEYSAVTDAPTAVSLTNHCYFNLAGLASGSIADHALLLHADVFVPSDPASFIPTDAAVEACSPVEGCDGRHDYRSARLLGPALAALADKGEDNGGYNMSYLVRGFGGPPPSPSALVDAGMGVELAALHAAGHAPASIDALRPAATLSHAPSGRWLHVATSSPCVHLYTCFAWPGNATCEGAAMMPSSALALECQYPADSANRAFGGGVIPRCTLEPGQEYRFLTLYSVGGGSGRCMTGT